MTKTLELNAISKAFDCKSVIESLSLDLSQGQIGCLLGASGCGKTTALRCIAGFEKIDSGSIRIQGTLVSSTGTCRPPEKRRLGMVFQEYALFPHLSVAQNIVFGLGHLSRPKQRRRTADLLDLVGMQGAANQYPHELSGGQQQRVALARALAPNPDLLLLDEPFSNLDVALRERLCLEVRRILKEVGITALLVTHNQHEAFAMADVIGVMSRGTLKQWDTAHNLYHRPHTPYVADFVGEGKLLRGRVTGPETVQTPLGTLKGRFSYPCRDGCPADVLIRPEDVLHDDNSPFKAEIRRKQFRGANILYTLKLDGHETVLALVSSHHNHAIGQKIGIRPQVDDIILFEADSHVISPSPH